MPGQFAVPAALSGLDTIGPLVAPGGRLHEARRVVAEACAEDGLVEAFAAEGDGAGFLLAVQWHPEWQARGNPVSEKLFTAFGDACRAYAAGRRAHG